MKKLPIVRWFDDLKSALSIYIAGNVAPSGGVTAGKFYFWKGKVRYPTSNISAGETLTDSNMPVVPEGGLNKVYEQKVNYSDILNELGSTATDKALSAAQGKALNDKFGGLKIEYLRIDPGASKTISGGMVYLIIGRSSNAALHFFKTWANYYEIYKTANIGYTLSGEYSMTVTNNYSVAINGFCIHD